MRQSESFQNFHQLSKKLNDLENKQARTDRQVRAHDETLNTELEIMHAGKNLLTIEGHNLSFLVKRVANVLWTAEELKTTRLCDENSPDRSSQTDRVPMANNAENQLKIEKLKKVIRHKYPNEAKDWNECWSFVKQKVNEIAKVIKQRDKRHKKESYNAALKMALDEGVNIEVAKGTAKAAEDARSLGTSLSASLFSAKAFIKLVVIHGATHEEAAAASLTIATSRLNGKDEAEATVEGLIALEAMQAASSSGANLNEATASGFAAAAAISTGLSKQGALDAGKATTEAIRTGSQTAKTSASVSAAKIFENARKRKKYANQTEDSDENEDDESDKGDEDDEDDEVSDEDDDSDENDEDDEDEEDD